MQGGHINNKIELVIVKINSVNVRPEIGNRALAFFLYSDTKKIQRIIECSDSFYESQVDKCSFHPAIPTIEDQAMLKWLLAKALLEILGPPLVFIPSKILAHIFQNESKFVPVLTFVIYLAVIVYSGLDIHRPVLINFLSESMPAMCWWKFRDLQFCQLMTGNIKMSAGLK
jgi:hypothetical protein